MPTRSPAKTVPKSVPKSARTPAKPRFSSTTRALLACCALAILVLVGYANSLSNGFVWDDHQQILLNPTLKPDTPWTTLFTSDARFAHTYGPVDTFVHNTDYRPLQLLTYRLLYASFGASATVFHLCSILFAIAATLAAFAVFWLLTRRLSLALPAAALFAIHPIHTESIDWIAALPELGFTLFLLLAFALLLIARTPTKTPRWLLITLSCLAYTISLFWKETAVISPLLIAVYGLTSAPSKTRILSALRQSAPYWLILAAFLSVRFATLGSIATAPRNWGLNPLQFAANSLYLFWSYCLKLAIPYPLNAYVLFQPIRSIADPRAVAALVATVIALVAIVFRNRRRVTSSSSQLPLFAALWILITLIPAFDINALGRNAFAERYLYLPSAGFCLLLVLVAARLLRLLPAPLRSRAATVATLLLLTAFAWQTIARNPDWKDDDTLFAETLLHSPDAPFVNVMVATSTPSEHAYLRAIELSNQQLPPDRVDALTAYEGLASLYADQSNFTRALAVLAQARALAPDNPEIGAEEGLILAQAGHLQQAEPLLLQALAAQPNNENVLSTLGLIARENHDLHRAEDLFLKALAIHTEEDDFAASLHNNLGAVYGDRENWSEALLHFRRATQILPSDPEFHVNLATALAAQNRVGEARTEALAALSIDANYPPAQDLLQRLPPSH